MPVGSVDEAIFAYIAKYPEQYQKFLQAGVKQSDFWDEHAVVWKYIQRMKRDHDRVPSADALQARFPDLELPPVKKKDRGILLTNLHERSRFKSLMEALLEANQETQNWEDVDGSIQLLTRRLNEIQSSNRKSHGKRALVDLFSPETSKRMLKEIKHRRRANTFGMPTGLKTFDEVTGGLQRQRMVTIIGRPGQGKSWLNLLFVASAVHQGHKVILYPLEMSLSETAFRLYSIFTQKCFGKNKALRNHDLEMGRITTKRVARFLKDLEARFAGQLLVADTSVMNEYTLERIESDVLAEKPDMFWIDYLTLMQSRGGKIEKSWDAVGQLSSGIKSIAMRHDTVGGVSAQVNRQYIEGKAFLPRLEHIAYGDSIGQDANQVVSIAKRGNHVYYSLVKNRHGPEIERKRVRFDVNRGMIEEEEEQIEEEE